MLFFYTRQYLFYYQCDNKIFANYVLPLKILSVRVFFKFFFFLFFFYLLNCLYRHISPFVVANIVPSVFFISIYYIFFIKYKTNLTDIAILSIYYVIYDYIIGNIPFVSITTFLACVLLIENFKKRTNNNILLHHYLISGWLFFVLKVLLELLLFDIKIHITNILAQLLIFSILATSFYISNVLEKQKQKVVY